MENCVVKEPSKIDWTQVIVAIIGGIALVAAAYVKH